MAAKPKSPTREPAEAWKSTNPARELDQTEQIAREIFSARPDLAPSVARIMNAELDAETRHRALTLFQAALGSLTDTNRDPRQAIANSQR